jgi:hypothetical protein
MKIGKVIDVKIEPYDYRAMDFNHPDKETKSERWKIAFTVPNDDWIDSEIGDQYKTVNVVKHFTSFNSDGKELTIKEALKSLKSSLIATHKAWKAGQEGLEQYQIRTVKYCSENAPHEISNNALKVFIKEINPERSSFSLDELDALDQYRYIYYGSLRFISLLMSKDHSDHIVFEDEESLLYWINSDN